MPLPGFNGPLRIGIAGPLFDPPASTKTWSIVGTVVTGAGAGIANAIVKLFDTSTDTLRGQTVSGAGGAFTFVVPGNSLTYWLLAYLPGSPDVFATSPNTLTAS